MRQQRIVYFFFNMQEKIVLLDGNSYIYRAYHALPKIVNSKGVNTNAIRGVLKMFSNIYKNVDFDYIACIFDSSKKNFRHQLYDKYKANRPQMPDDLSIQIPYIHEIVDLIGWNKLIVDGVEADDVIGTIAKQASSVNIRAHIYTKDKDAAQLVDDNIKIIEPSTNDSFDKQKIYVRFGVYPYQIIDYLTLLGDVCDNVPGVDKVGKKTASSWLSKYNTIEGIVENANLINGVAIDNLISSIDQLSLSRKLVTIKTDCDLSAYVKDWPSLESLKPKELRRKEIRDIKDVCEIRS